MGYIRDTCRTFRPVSTLWVGHLFVRNVLGESVFDTVRSEKSQLNCPVAL